MLKLVRSVAMVAVLVLVGCSSSSSSDKDTTPAGDVAGEAAGQDVAQQDNAAPDVPPAEVAPDTAEPEDIGPADAGTPDTAANPWDVVVNLKVAEATTPVNLKDLEKTTYDGKDAVRLTRVIEMLALEMPWNYHYSPVGNDGFKPLDAKLGGELGALPYYGELENGYLLFNDEGALALAWDPTLGLPKSLGVKGMDNGTIEVIQIAETSVLVQVGEARKMVDVTVLPTVDVVDYKKPEDGAKPMVPLTDVLTAAGATGADALVYQFVGKDGFMNNLDNLMPFANLEHAYIRPDGRRIIIEKEWDTDVCCWRVKDTVLIHGLTL
jgi:hypothetical protein